MATVPTLSNQVRQEAAPNVQQRALRSTALEDVGGGLQDVGNTLFKVRQEEQLKADRAAFMEADRNTDTVANDLYAEASSKQFKDAIGITPSAIESFDKKAGEIETSLKTDRQKAVYRESVNNRRSQLQRQISNHEGQQTQAYYAKSREDYKDQAHVNAVTYYNDPKRVESEIDKIRATVDQSPGMDAEQKSTELGIRRSGVYAGVVERYLANDDIRGADAYYKSIKDNVNGDKAARIENSINDAKRQAEARNHALVDRRDAVAERTLNEIDRQIVSGVPATPAMWAGWENKVRGSTLGDEFKARLNEERKVQDLLIKPIDQQITEVQRRRAELDQSGGTLREAANVQRLQGAVQKNLQTLQQEPLVFSAQRAGLEIPPLNLGDLGNPDTHGNVAASLQERVDTIKAMRKQYGPQVAMKPLLPQEAAQLSSAVNSASPDRAAGLFGSLYNAVGSDEAYTAIMQQIAPDSPVKSLAGLLAAKDRTATLKTHWFRANDTLDSHQVASTLLEGQDILKPSKTDKAADGAPKLSLYLPAAVEPSLQTEFASQVGTAFQDRPDAAQTAYQAVKAYYVGKAAQTGLIANDKTAVDAGIVKEAVRGILGNVVNVNGRGEVLAPWGMEAGEFRDAARTAFDKQSVNWPDGSKLPFDVLGLKAAGSDSYYVTAGRTFLQDKNGNPVTLNLGQQ